MDFKSHFKKHLFRNKSAARVAQQEIFAKIHVNRDRAQPTVYCILET